MKRQKVEWLNAIISPQNAEKADLLAAYNDEHYFCLNNIKILKKGGHKFLQKSQEGNIEYLNWLWELKSPKESASFLYHNTYLASISSDRWPLIPTGDPDELTTGSPIVDQVSFSNNSHKLPLFHYPKMFDKLACCNEEIEENWSPCIRPWQISCQRGEMKWVEDFSTHAVLFREKFRPPSAAIMKLITPRFQTDGDTGNTISVPLFDANRNQLVNISPRNINLLDETSKDITVVQTDAQHPLPRSEESLATAHSDSYVPSKASQPIEAEYMCHKSLKRDAFLAAFGRHADGLLDSVIEMIFSFFGSAMDCIPNPTESITWEHILFCLQANGNDLLRRKLSNLRVHPDLIDLRLTGSALQKIQNRMIRLFRFSSYGPLKRRRFSNLWKPGKLVRLNRDEKTSLRKRNEILRKPPQ